MKVGLVPISAKPYHKGHHYLIENAARENDEVIVFASTSDRCRSGEFPVYGKTMIEVWNDLIVPNMPENVSVRFGGSPVRNVYEMLGDACENNDFENVYTVYSDIVDTKANYPSASRKKYMNPLYEAGNIAFAAEHATSNYIRGADAPNVRGEDLRRCLEAEDFLGFSQLVPECINKVEYWHKLTVAV